MLALVRHLNFQRQRLTGLHRLPPGAGLGDDFDLARTLVASNAPIDAKLLQVADDLLVFLLLNALDDRLRLAKHLRALGRLGVQHEVLREADEEVLLVLVLLFVWLRLEQALAKLGVEVVAHHDRRPLRIGRALVGEVSIEVRFADVELVDLEIHVFLVDGHRADRDVGHDADALNRDVTRSEILSDRELERRLIGELVENLDRTLAEALLADDERAVVVLERACHDLARGRALRVHQDDHRVAGLGVFARRVLLLALPRIL